MDDTIAGDNKPNEYQILIG